MPLGIYVPSRAEDLSLSFASGVDSAAQGALLYRNGSSLYAPLAASTAGFVLRTGGAGADPSWVDSATLTPSSGAVILAPGSSTRNVIQPTGDFKPLILKGFAGQTANMFEVQDSAGAAGLTVVSDGALHIGTVDTSAFLNVTKTRTSLSGQARGYLINLTADPSANSSATFRGGMYVVGSPLGNTFNFTGSLTGLFCQSTHSGTGSITTLRALQTVTANGGGGAVTTMTGVDIGVNLSTTAATVTEMNGLASLITVGPSGTAVTRAHGVHVQSPSVVAGSSLTTNYGVRIRNQGNALITTSYAIDIDPQTNSTTPFSIRSQGGQCLLMAGATGVVPLTAQGASGQTADLFNCSTNAPLVLFGISASGIGTHLLSDATTNVATDSLIMDHRSSGTPAAGFGQALRFRAKSSTTNSRDVGCLAGVWATATDASRKGQMLLMAADAAGEREVLRGESSGTAAMISFLGATAVVRQTAAAASTDLASVITLANSLRTGLINLGLFA